MPGGVSILFFLILVVSRSHECQTQTLDLSLAKLPDPVFECVSENLVKTWEKNGKLFRKLEFTFRLGFKDKEYFATAPLKKTAKTQVATEAWNLIRGELF